ncbi:MAG: substrate-binding domain-containing protein, partial [Pricia sp.]
LVLVSKLSKEDGFRLAEKIVKEFDGVDGIFSANDFAAIGVMNHLKRIGVKIPQDIAIAGFSNEPTSEVIEPSLTTVDQSGNEIGRLACNLLLDYFENGNTLVNDKTIMIQPQLIVRNSTRKK